MRKKHFLTLVLLGFAMSASAQIQLLYMNCGRHIIDRNKKLYWMDGDDDPCYDILNYKKTGNKETFSLIAKEDKNDKYNVQITLDGKGTPTEITLSGTYMSKTTSPVKTYSDSPSYDAHLHEYFGRLAGYPQKEKTEQTQTVTPSATPAAESPTDAAESPTDAVEKTKGSVKSTAKKALGKVKGLFGKKK